MDHKVLNTSMTQIRHEGNGEKQKKSRLHSIIYHIQLLNSRVLKDNCSTLISYTNTPQNSTGKLVMESLFSNRLQHRCKRYNRK